MFTHPRPAPFGRPHQLANTYARVGVETNVNVASPHKLIALLFDGLADSLVIARSAMAAGQIEAKCAAIQRAARIIEEGLKAGLNLESGLKLADDLHALYSYSVLRLTYANLHNDQNAILEVQKLMQPLREAWHEIGPQVEGARN